MRYFTFVVAIGLLWGSTTKAETACKSSPCVTVDLYYESLCTDSMNFIKTQLVPSYYYLKDYLSINFIPYGKASHQLDDSKQYTFTCQHGPMECDGNKAQVCAYETILNINRTAEEKQAMAMAFIGCVMSNDDPSEAVQNCATSAGLCSKEKSKIDDCIKSAAGNALLAVYGDKTDSLNPKLSFVPTIVLDGVYSEDNQKAALTNFKKLICDRIPIESRPRNCGD